MADPVKVPGEINFQLRNAAPLDFGAPGERTHREQFLITKAAQWGADQELEACCEWFDAHIPGYEMVVDRLRAARRPKPPTLAEQALKLLPDLGMTIRVSTDQAETIRAALNRLAELEAQQ